MRAILDLPGVVPGILAHRQGFTRAGTRAWQRRLFNSRRLVGGVFFLLLLAAAPAAARDGVVRFEWARAPEADVSYYVVERAGSTEWVEVARVRNAEDEPLFNPARGVFAFDSPVDSDPGRWRLIAVDAHGNTSPPVYLVPEPSPVPPPPSCTWQVAGCAVPVRCERACTCEVVVQRLDEARQDLIDAGVLERPELLDQALCLTTVALVGPERLVLPGGQQAAGAATEGWLLLARDMRAAAHEMFHLYEIATGKAPDHAHQHDRWMSDPRLRAIDRKHHVGGWER